MTPKLRETRQIGPMGLRAAFVPGSVNEERRTVELCWTTGARVLRAPWWGDAYYEELSLDAKHVRLDRLNSGRAPLLDTHDGYRLGSVLGVVESVTLNKKEGTAVVRFARAEDDPEADVIYRKVVDGIIGNVSVGYRVYRYDSVEEEGELKVKRATDWEPFEISLVPMGADGDGAVRSAAVQTNPCEFTGPQETRSMEDEEETGTPPSPAPENRSPVDPDKVRAEATASERKRASAIRRFARALGVEQLVNEHVDAGTSIDEFRELALAEKERTTAPPPGQPIGVEGGEDLSRRHAGDGLRNAILHRADPAHHELTEVGRLFRGRRLLEMGREYLRRHGEEVDDLTPMELASRLLGLDSGMRGRSGGMHSTSDFPLILADVSGKSLRAAYDEAPQTFQPISRRVSLPDFKPVKRNQLGEAPQLLKVSEGGEFTRGTLGEGKEQYALATYGRVFPITRQTLINDDMDAFSRTPAMFGVQARELESDLVWAEFLTAVMSDSNALFHNAHGNSGTGIIDITGLGLGRKAMRKQTGLDGRTKISVQAKYLLVPVALETTAEQFVSKNLRADSAGNINVFAGRLEVLAEPRLDDDDDDAWYLAASSGQIDTMEYAYLDGENGPVLESRLGFDVDGIELKARHDFAAKVIDWRGFYKSDGQAIG